MRLEHMQIKQDTIIMQFRHCEIVLPIINGHIDIDSGMIIEFKKLDVIPASTCKLDSDGLEEFAGTE